MTNNATKPTPPQLGAIWAQTVDGIIGRNGTMPWYVPEDLNHFKEITAGKPVIMGRRSVESFQIMPSICAANNDTALPRVYIVDNGKPCMSVPLTA